MAITSTAQIEIVSTKKLFCNEADIIIPLTDQEYTIATLPDNQLGIIARRNCQFLHEGHCFAQETYGKYDTCQVRVK